MAGAIPALKEKYGLEPDYEVEAYTIEEVFGLTRENRPPNMRQTLYIEDNLFAKLPVLEEGNKELTSQLWTNLGPDLKIYFVTARDNHPVVMRDTREWLKLNTDHFDDVFHVQKKAEFCKLAGIQVMIEDEVRQISELLNAGIDVIMRDQPWNQHLPADPSGNRWARVDRRRLSTGNESGTLILNGTWLGPRRLAPCPRRKINGGEESSEREAGPGRPGGDLSSPRPGAGDHRIRPGWQGGHGEREFPRHLRIRR